MNERSSNSGPRATTEFRGLEPLLLTWRLLRDGRVPAWMKAAVPAVAGIYLAFPIDLIPDFILGFGQVDDLGVIGLALFALTKVLPKLAPRAVIDEHLAEMRGGRSGTWQDKNKTKDDQVVDTTFTVVNEQPQRR
jgi:uncharacterized membrane protein YkvA (DUF1232 family)